MADSRRRQSSRTSSNRRYSVRKKRRRITITIIVSAVIVVLLVAGAWFYFRYRTFDNYKIVADLDIANSDERTLYAEGSSGYIKCASDGITYFDKNGILWAETYEMTQPIMDTCGSYTAVADLKGSDIYVFDENGLVNRMSVSHPILDIEVSEQGVVAAGTIEGTSNFIEVLDKDGNELITAKTVFTSSGYLMDIALSPDGESLAAAFIYVSEGNLESKVVFYDFSSENEIAGGFNQYKDTAVTNVEFLNPTTVCAVGDNAVTIYKIKPTPTIVYEDLNLQWELQSAFFGNNKLGLIVEDESSESGYTAKVYDTRGKIIADIGFDFAYSHVAFSGNNVLLHSVNDCELYSFYGPKRFSYTFDERIEYLLPIGSGREYIYATANNTEFIKLK